MKQQTALITGITGGLAQLVGAELAKRNFKIVGVDYRPLKNILGYPAEIYQANYNKTRIADIFRRHRPSCVLHLGRVGNLKERMGKRFDLNVVGSGKIMELCVKHEVQRLLILSTFHIYGAHPHNHIPIYEEEPLRAGPQFPQIADAIQLDNMATTWIWRHPEVKTVLLRPCNVVGPNIKNAISRFLRQRFLPVILGFDPMTQFIHESDLKEALVATTETQDVGVYNVAGISPIPWREALSLAPGQIVPVPSTLASLYLSMGRSLGTSLPPYLVNFQKYPCVVATDAIRSTFGWEPRVSEVDAIRSTVAATVF